MAKNLIKSSQVLSGHLTSNSRQPFPFSSSKQDGKPFANSGPPTESSI